MARSAAGSRRMARSRSRQRTNSTDRHVHLRLGTVNGAPAPRRRITATVTITVNAGERPADDLGEERLFRRLRDRRARTRARIRAQACVHFDSAGPCNESSQRSDSWVIQVVRHGRVLVRAELRESRRTMGSSSSLRPRARPATRRCRCGRGTAAERQQRRRPQQRDRHPHPRRQQPADGERGQLHRAEEHDAQRRRAGRPAQRQRPDGDPLTAVKVTNPVHGVVILASDGSFSYTPASWLRRARRVLVQGVRRAAERVRTRS